MLARSLALITLALTACKPEASSETTADSSTSSTGPSTGEPTGEPTTGAPTTGEPTTGAAVVPDDQLCQAYCDNIVASGCSTGCSVQLCIDEIGFATTAGCGDPWRAKIACEGKTPLDYGCEATGCVPEYLALDICEGGNCKRLGAIYGSIVGDTECDWSADGCYGHDFNMHCEATPDAQCTCMIDGMEVASCALGADLGPQMCGDDHAAFKGCCTDVFIAAILDP